MGKLSNISPYKGDGVTPRLQKWLDILYDALRDASKLNTIVNTTSLSSDYALSVGETAQIDITTDSVPLNIAVEDGWYEITIEYDISTFSADRAIALEINNTTYTNDFLITKFVASTGLATDEVDTNDATADSHLMTIGLAGGSTIKPYRVDASLVISGQRSKLFAIHYGTSTGTRVAGYVHSIRNNTPAHTSLGTLNSGETCTGTVYVHRRA